MSLFTWSETLPSVFGGLVFLILLGLLVGLIILCRLIQGLALTSAFPVGFARRWLSVRGFYEWMKI